MMRRVLVAVGLWLARCGGWIPPQTQTRFSVTSPYITQAIAWCEWADRTMPVAGGEAKRHQVYARLIKAFPEAPHRHLALAIELALR